MPIRVTSGRWLSPNQRSNLKISLQDLGWIQNEYRKWEHPSNKRRIGPQGYTLLGAANRAGLVTTNR